MLGRLRGRLDIAGAAFGRVFANPDLRRLQLAAAGSIIGSWAYAVALAVYAYDVGGAAAVGLVALLRYVPSALASPFTSLLADRYPRVRVMLAADLIRAFAMVIAGGAIALDLPAAIVFAAAAVSTVTSTAFNPAKRAVLPTLARSPEELTAANVATSTVESVGIFVGPAIGGLLLAATGPDVVFGFNALTFLWSAHLVWRIRADEPREDMREPSARPPLRAELAAGLRTLREVPAARTVVLLISAQTFVFGALTVLVVVLALDILDTGASGVGFLNSALGVGGLLGSLAAFALVGRPRLGGSFALGIVLWGLPLVLVAAWPEPVVALLLFGVIGVANTLVDVSGFTLLQRTVADTVLARVFGVLEALMTITIGLGALAAPLLIALVGERPALVVTGFLLPLLAALSWRALRRVDETARPPGRELELLQSVPMFAPLPPATLEHLAASLVPVDVPAGSPVFRAGDRGDRFYLVADGEVEISLDGRPSEPLGPGGWFGEIALLRDVARTATVTARTDSRLLALDREEFVAAVTGHPESAEAADAVVGARLGTLPQGAL
jgi:predicted MFS family arabinose efflux permease